LFSTPEISPTTPRMPAKDTVTLDDDVELRTVALASPLNRTMVKDAIYTEETLETAKGKVLVAWAGDRGGIHQTQAKFKQRFKICVKKSRMK
jgi:hypothetical protein